MGCGASTPAPSATEPPIQGKVAPTEQTVVVGAVEACPPTVAVIKAPAPEPVVEDSAKDGEAMAAWKMQDAVKWEEWKAAVKAPAAVESTPKPVAEAEPTPEPVAEPAAEADATEKAAMVAEAAPVEEAAPTAELVTEAAAE